MVVGVARTWIDEHKEGINRNSIIHNVITCQVGSAWTSSSSATIYQETCALGGKERMNESNCGACRAILVRLDDFITAFMCCRVRLLPDMWFCATMLKAAETFADRYILHSKHAARDSYYTKSLLK